MSTVIEYTRFSKSESCSEDGCRARKFYIENGKKFCQRGHEQAGFTQTQQDEDDWNTQGRKVRRAREDKERVSRTLEGRDATDLYLRCYGLILWKQCHWLLTVKGLPEEFETIVRDLWGLRMKELRKEPEGKGGFSSLSGYSSTEGETSDSEGTSMSLSSRRKGRKVKSKERLPTLIETLALCYLAILLLRLPISLGDVFRWATRDEIIYTRAIKEVPLDMRNRLPPHFHIALEIHSQLKGADLQGAVLELVEFYNLYLEMVFPPLNIPPLLYKHLRDLALPPEIYPAVKSLAKILGIDFSYPLMHMRVYGVTAYPEIQLMSLVVVATKLCYPIDDIVRCPESYEDPSVAKIPWDKWRKVMEEKPAQGLKRGQEIKATQDGVFDMTGEALDDYLDWYERTWIDDREPKMAQQILDLFPLQDLPPRPVIESDLEEIDVKLRKVQSSLIIQKPLEMAEDEDPKEVMRPGSLYRRYRTVDSLSENAKAFYKRAADNVGIPLNMLTRGVLQTENQLDRWALGERRRKLAEEMRRELDDDGDGYSDP